MFQQKLLNTTHAGCCPVESENLEENIFQPVAVPEPKIPAGDRPEKAEDGGGAAHGWVGFGGKEGRGAWGGVIHRAEVWEER